MLKKSLGKLASEFPGVAYISGAGSGRCLEASVVLKLTTPGIGAATAQAFVRAGCSRVFLTDLNPSTLERTTKSLRDLSPDVRVETAAGDISSRHFIDEIFDKLHGDFGRLDYAVNCAGMIGSGKSTSESSVEEFDKVTDVNYRGVWMCSRRQLQMMKEQPLLEQGQEDQRRRQRGSIVNIASQLGIVGRPKSCECISVPLSPGLNCMPRVGQTIPFRVTFFTIVASPPRLVRSKITTNSEQPRIAQPNPP